MAKAERSVQIVRGLTFGREAFQATTFATKARRRQAVGTWLAIGQAVLASDGAAAARAMEALYDQAFHFIAVEWSANPSTDRHAATAVTGSSR
jgi:DNA-binding GntR family transcriptional regulator